MNYRTLPQTDVSVSEVGFGVWTLTTGWWGDYTDAEAARLLDRAFELGITFFDTADTYGAGRGETVLAKAFRGRMDDIIVATKFGYDFYKYPERPPGQRELPQDWSPEYIRFACNESLKRLKREHIDIYQIHNPKTDTVLLDDVYATLEDLRSEGKVRAYGVAFGPANGWIVEAKAAMRARRFDTVQIIHNLFEQYPGAPLVDEATATGKSALVRVPHSSGLLEGRYTEETTFDPKDHRSHRPRSWLVNGLKKLETIQFLLDGRDGATIGQIALKWLLAKPCVVTTLPNIYDEEQLVDLAGTSDCPDLTPVEMEKLERLYEENFGIEEPVMAFKGVAEDSDQARELMAAASA